MRPKDGENKLHSEAFILSEKIDDSKSKKSDKDIKKEMKRLEKEKMEREKRERKVKEKEKEREKQAKKGKVMCGACGGKCSGEVLRVSDKYFHTACFTCRTCSASLAKGGFFAKDGHYYCPQDYQRAFGTRCAACHQYVEGEVVSALGNTYHQKCFTCARCNRAFPSGEKVTYTGAEVVCSSCVAGPVRQTAREASRSPLGEGGEGGEGGDGAPEVDEGACAGCGAELAEGQALVALERQWHPGCFACAACGAVLAGEYLGRAGRPYCERDYQRLFGVRCAYCARYIAGKVLQAGDAHHFHPTCARCSKCGDPFGDGEEMFLQGAAIWHPRCGPAPGRDPRDPRDPRDTASDDMQFSLRSRTPSVNGSYCSPYSSLNRKYTWCASPGLTLRSGGVSPARITTYSYLTSEPGYLRRPLQPPPPASPHFHRPAGGEAARPASRARSAMAALVDSMRADTPRARSPGPRADEPIELAAYPGAHPPAPGTPAPLDRPDFPAPPYAVPPRRAPPDDEPEPAPELERLAASSGLAQALLRAARAPRALDPRNASRTASAAREPPARLRYPSPLGASPSRRADREPDAAPVDAPRAYNVVSSLRAAPRPGYGLAARSHTFSSSTAVDFTFSGLGDKTHSTDFSSGKSDMSAGSVSEVPYGGGGGGARRSLPNMADSLLVHEPAKLYPYHLLLITNYRLPPDVDRLNLERHLSDAEFECILQTQRRDFYRLPQWRRNELKRRARLF